MLKLTLRQLMVKSEKYFMLDLLPSVKINTTIDWHGDSFQLSSSFNREDNNSWRRESPASSHHFPFAPLGKTISRKGAKAQRLRLNAQTMIKAQLINWVYAVKIKIQPKASVLPTLNPKKIRNMSPIFC